MMFDRTLTPCVTLSILSDCIPTCKYLNSVVSFRRLVNIRNELRGEFGRMTDTHGKTIRTIVGLPKQEEIHIDLRAYVEPEQRFLNGKDGDTRTVYGVVFDN